MIKTVDAHWSMCLALDTLRFDVLLLQGDPKHTGRKSSEVFHCGSIFISPSALPLFPWRSQLRSCPSVKVMNLLTVFDDRFFLSSLSLIICRCTVICLDVNFLVCILVGILWFSQLWGSMFSINSEKFSDIVSSNLLNSISLILPLLDHWKILATHLCWFSPFCFVCSHTYSSLVITGHHIWKGFVEILEMWMLLLFSTKDFCLVLPGSWDPKHPIQVPYLWFPGPNFTISLGHWKPR